MSTNPGSSSTASSAIGASANVAARARALVGEITTLRRDLHAHPELRFEEERTGAAIARELEAAGLEVRRGVAKTGVVGLLRGARPGPTVALRADMDALPLTEETGLPYASTHPGRMHACGHDGHVAMLVGTARVLAGMRGELSGSVKFFFQPAEEGGHGGLRMCEAGVLEDPRVDAIFALHDWPFLPVGDIGIRYGPMMAATDSFAIEVLGQGGHAAYPHKVVDPILLACRIVEGLQSIVSREVNPVDAVVVTVGKLHAGTAVNIIPNFARMEGTVRSMSVAGRESALAAVARIAEGTATAHRGRVKVEITPGYPPTVNHDAACDLVRAAAEEVVGAARVSILGEPSMGGEDFSYYLQRVPGAMFRLGIARGAVEAEPALHTTTFNFNDDAIEVGIRTLAGTALRFLEAGLPGGKGDR
ncbi:MAG: amidohydrolase [Planctomycetes bacterium]|nr:amidohydrolase [Planctomycetota bacterium]